MFPIGGNMLLETDELAQSRVSTWECSKFNKAIQAGGKEFFRFCYFKDALASLRVESPSFESEETEHLYIGYCT